MKGILSYFLSGEDEVALTEKKVESMLHEIVVQELF